MTVYTTHLYQVVVVIDRQLLQCSNDAVGIHVESILVLSSVAFPFTDSKPEASGRLHVDEQGYVMNSMHNVLRCHTAILYKMVNN